MANEKFSIVKFFRLDGMSFAKALALGLRILIVVLIVFGGIKLWQVIFPKPAQLHNNPTFHVAEGAKVEYKNIQNEDKRRVEFFVGTFGSTSVKDSNDTRIGLFGGIKW